MPIKVLPPELASKIAAGEVVERPASVVKELVENSLDALATRITVEIQGGGVRQVRVTDNGQGISADQLELAFLRHATSKIQSQEQLDSVGTLGFRGEALPSIAAVSRLTMTTRTHGDDAAHWVRLEWGSFEQSGSQGAAPGTSVCVEDLFENMPARRKFLRSATTEAGRIQELVSRYALVYPEVAFLLTNEGRRVFQTQGNGNARGPLAAVFGPEAAGLMLEIDGEDPESGYAVHGFISPPSLNRANRTQLTFFVNRRWIQSRMLAYALEEAYHGLLPERRYPMAAVGLSVPLEQVDVNYHPTKREVRFHQEGKAFATLQRAVRSALIEQSPVPVMHPPGESPWRPSPGPATAGPSFFPSTPFAGSGSSSPGGGEWKGALPRPAAPALKVVGQMKLTYIVAEGPEGMFLVDQHAAHERVLFDRLVADQNPGGGERAPQSQALLQPAEVELSPSQLDTLINNSEKLAAYGFIVEPFGGNSYLLRAVPAVVAAKEGGDPAGSLVDVLDMVAFEGLMRRQEDVLAASIACHGAIRAGKPLTEPEMRSLLEQLEGADNPHTCPHGRPTMVHFSSYQVEKEFGRR